MIDIIGRLVTSTRIITLMTSFMMVMLKTQFPDLGITEKDLSDFLWVAIAVITGDTIRPVNPDKPALFGPGSSSVK